MKIGNIVLVILIIIGVLIVSINIVKTDEINQSNKGIVNNEPIKSNEIYEIYNSYSEDSGAHIPFIEAISIYSDGTIKKERYTESKITKKKLSNEDFNKLKSLINEIENSELIYSQEPLKFIPSNGGFKHEDYINLNKKIIIFTSKFNGNESESGITRYTNEKVEELNEFIKKLEEKYLKEE